MKVSGDLFEIDANVILRYILQDDAVLSPKASEIMQAVAKRSISVSCDPVILGEVIWVLTSFYRFPKDRIVSSVEHVIKDDGFLMSNKDRYIRALSIFAQSSAHFGDACACAAALECSDGRLLSFDRELSRIPGIRRLEKPISR